MRSTRALLFAALLPLWAACASSPKQQSLPPQTMAPSAPPIEEPVSTAPQELPPESIATNATARPEEPAGEPAEAAADAGTPAAEDEAASAGEEPEGITVVIESPAQAEEQPRSLVAAAEAEQRRRREVGESTIVINDKNLEEYAAKGQLTFVEEEDEQAAGEEDGAGDAAETAEALAETAAEEQYWRDRVGDVRQSWRDEIDRITELEEKVAALRHDFYAEDDPFYRDSQIKPAWDQALEDLEESRHAAVELQEELDRVLEEGRRAGALPGWLREGLELEPTAEELEVLERPEEDGEFHQPSEPIILDEDGSEGRPGS